MTSPSFQKSEPKSVDAAVDSLVGEFLGVAKTETKAETKPETKAEEATALDNSIDNALKGLNLDNVFNPTPKESPKKAPKKEAPKKEEAPKEEAPKEKDDNDDIILDDYSKRLLESEHKPKEKAGEPPKEKAEDDADAEELPANASAAAKTAFKNIRFKLKEAKAEIAKLAPLQDQVKELDIIKKQLEILQARDNDREEILYRTNLKETDMYKEAVIVPTEKIRTALAAIAKNATSDDASYRELFGKLAGVIQGDIVDKEEINDLVADLSILDRGKLSTLVEKYQEVQATKKQITTKQRQQVEAERAAHIEAQEKAQAELAKMSKKSHDDMIAARLAEWQNSPLFEGGDLNTFTEFVEKLQAAPVVFNSENGPITATKLTPDQIAELSLAVPLARHLKNVVEKQSTTIKELYTRLKKMKGATPSPKAEAGVQAVATPNEVESLLGLAGLSIKDLK